MLFKKKPKKVKLIDFSGHRIGTGQVGMYILFLYEFEDFAHIGYDYEKNKYGDLRFNLYVPDKSYNRIIQYFKDRCPAIVEKECEEYSKWFKTHSPGKYFETVDYHGFKEVRLKEV